MKRSRDVDYSLLSRLITMRLMEAAFSLLHFFEDYSGRRQTGVTQKKQGLKNAEEG